MLQRWSSSARCRVCQERLTTTEDNSQREHLEEVKIREEKAVSERQLQQKKLDRIEMAEADQPDLRGEERANPQLSG
jgi:uncharacterized membrane protein YdbT with pleckstrin-like domain